MLSCMSVASLGFSEAYDLAVNVKMFFRDVRSLQASLKQETALEVLVLVTPKKNWKTQSLKAQSTTANIECNMQNKPTFKASHDWEVMLSNLELAVWEKEDTQRVAVNLTERISIQFLIKKSRLLGFGSALQRHQTRWAGDAVEPGAKETCPAANRAARRCQKLQPSCCGPVLKDGDTSVRGTSEQVSSVAQQCVVKVCSITYHKDHDQFPHTGTEMCTSLSVSTKLTPSAFQKEMSLTIKQRLASTQEMNLPQVVQLPDKSETSITSNVLEKSNIVFCLQGFSSDSLSYTNLDCMDFFHQLLCIIEKFIVPICAIGAQAILDFPGQLDFSECPVKCSTQKRWEQQLVTSWAPRDVAGNNHLFIALFFLLKNPLPTKGRYLPDKADVAISGFQELA
ncbi:hypothetical protein DUI87_14176 [Hirundo rustica rustica]|uniref:Uncharacterized protein n=1 Tax=Hirundo rustica rustica TaxID=333673 RepID=A0A3M0K7P1_HIRRU|nr:hypothetical protein DUI87_14176 [Hirundo rustica rustica]